MAVIKNRLASAYGSYADVAKPIDTLKLEFKGNFVYNNIYAMLKQWLEDNDWFSGKDDEWPESFYHHRLNQKNEADNLIFLHFTKDGKLEKKLGLVKFALDITVIANSVKDVEVKLNGKTYQVQSGKLQFELTPRVLFKHKTYFEPTLWFNLLHSFSGQFREEVKNRQLGAKEYIRDETLGLKNALQHYFNLENYLGETPKEFLHQRANFEG